jgi:hypothetical protein
VPCSGCRKKVVRKSNPKDVMGGYKYLNAKQLEARLAVFKNRYCSDCKKIEKCDFAMYKACKGG